jgi:glycolate oxidase FAD binding subunit
MKPTSIPELQAMVRAEHRLRLRGGGSKTALVAPQDGVSWLDLTGLAGMLEYRPEEYVFTALAGTRLAEVERILGENGQYLPFDPPLAEHGATLGGTVAAGLSGPGRYRYGGLRDFLLGVQYINAQGESVRGGGKVVKNAAGFDLPKLMIGSLGQYGPLVELSFKVFPRPAASATLQAEYGALPSALAAVVRLNGLPLELFGLELAPGGAGWLVQIRLGGQPEGLSSRLERLHALLAQEGPVQTGVIEAAEEAQVWRAAREFSWLPAGCALIKVPITPKRVPAFDARLSGRQAARRYSVGANLAWLAWREPLVELDDLLRGAGLAGLVVHGVGGPIRLGIASGEAFARRVRQALDPAGKFAVSGW